MEEKKQDKQYFTVAELAGILGVTRSAVHKRIKSGEIKTTRLGKLHVISADSLPAILRTVIGEERKEDIEAVVKRVVKEYGQTLKLLGEE